MSTLLVGFDSAWTPNNSGALVGVLRIEDGTLHELGSPEVADFLSAEEIILGWQGQHSPTTTLVLLDQPTVVNNATGMRPVEKLVASPVCRRKGGVQPANIGREKMFGKRAPVWRFLIRFGGPADPLETTAGTLVFETYPVLAMIALGWTLKDSRSAGRLPKYNPKRKNTYSIDDWKYVCQQVSSALSERKLSKLVYWLDNARCHSPCKSDQDGLDACICLLVALYWAESKECLMVGDLKTGYMVVPYGKDLHGELTDRCEKTGQEPSEWVQLFRLSDGTS